MPGLRGLSARQGPSHRPDDFKPMPSIGKGVEEITTARLRDAVYVLHAFQKKAQATSKRDTDIARQRLAQVMKERM